MGIQGYSKQTLRLGLGETTFLAYGYFPEKANRLSFISLSYYFCSVKIKWSHPESHHDENKSHWVSRIETVSLQKCLDHMSAMAPQCSYCWFGALGARDQKGRSHWPRAPPGAFDGIRPDPYCWQDLVVCFMFSKFGSYLSPVFPPKPLHSLAFGFLLHSSFPKEGMKLPGQIIEWPAWFTWKVSLLPLNYSGFENVCVKGKNT